MLTKSIATNANGQSINHVINVVLLISSWVGKLREKYPSRAQLFPFLPSKKYIGSSLSADFVDKRQRDLGYYMTSILHSCPLVLFNPACLSMAPSWSSILPVCVTASSSCRTKSSIRFWRSSATSWSAHGNRSGSASAPSRQLHRGSTARTRSCAFRNNALPPFSSMHGINICSFSHPSILALPLSSALSMPSSERISRRHDRRLGSKGVHAYREVTKNLSVATSLPFPLAHRRIGREEKTSVE